MGIIERADNILWYSSIEISRYMTLVKYAISFAQNIRDGRLDEIGHVPFLQHEQKTDALENHVMLVKTKSFLAKKDEIILHFCLDYTESELRKDLAIQLLELFIEKFLDKVKIKAKFLEKLEDKNDEFTSTCDDTFQEVMTTNQLMAEVETGLQLDTQDTKEKKMNLLFAAVSVQGVPISAKFYEDMASHFRLSVSDKEEANSVLENLISAQLSTLCYESVVQGTSCTHMCLKFTDLLSFTERQLTVNFFPVNDTGRKILQQDDFSFIIMNEGDPDLARTFQMSVSPLFSQTGLFKERFSGNVSRYSAVKLLLDGFPKTLRS
nr:hypothetical protein [Candidatus Sigynarchaeota archaeon]